MNPRWVKLAKEAGVRVVSVIGFPLGANTLAIKVAEVEQAIKDGADELDLVINRLENMEQEVKAVVKAASGRFSENNN